MKQKVKNQKRKYQAPTYPIPNTMQTEQKNYRTNKEENVFFFLQGFIIQSLKLIQNIREYSRERASTNMREKMRNQNLGKYFSGDKAVLTWEISGGIQLPLEGQPHGLFSSLDELPRTTPHQVTSVSLPKVLYLFHLNKYICACV